MVFVNEKIEDGKWQTIDKEKNISLTRVSGPDQEGDYRCELVYKETPIRFDGTSGMKIHGTPKLGEEQQYEMNWTIFALYIIEELEPERQNIKSAIVDALNVWGWNYRPEKAYSVDVKFTPNIS